MDQTPARSCPAPRSGHGVRGPAFAAVIVGAMLAAVLVATSAAPAWKAPARTSVYGRAGVAGLDAGAGPVGLSPRALGAARRPRTGFAGHTSDESPLVIKVSKDGRRVRAIAIHWEAACTSGERFPFGDVLLATRKPKPPSGPVSGNPYFGERIAKSGRFAGSSLSTIEFSSGVANVTQEISGRLGGAKGSGSWHAHVDVRDRQSGQAIDSCDTGNLRWTAPRPQKAFYGGITTQLEPVVLQLNRSGRAVRLFRIGWAARCTPAGAFTLGDAFEKFPLRRGRFGDRFSQRFPQQTGGYKSLDYELTGKLTRRKATGTFKARYTEVDANGTKTGDCVSPTIKWRADR